VANTVFITKIIVENVLKGYQIMRVFVMNIKRNESLMFVIIELENIISIVPSILEINKQRFTKKDEKKKKTKETICKSS
jgi:hypothetical protein